MYEDNLTQVFEIAKNMDDQEFVYIYEHCMGGVFTSMEQLSYEETYCDICGDSSSIITCGSKSTILQECCEMLIQKNNSLNEENDKLYDDMINS